MKLSRAAELMDGRMHGEDLDFQRVSTDSRSLQAGDLFLALSGDNFDGHEFLSAAASAGACAAVTGRATDAFSSYVRVADTRRALGLLAARWRDQYASRRVAVTGNAGKTTVKEMIALALGEAVHATHGNLNNDIGVPLTLLGVNDRHRYGVFELGANAPGEIEWTSSLVKPEIALITNVTGAHLEGFGSLDGIARAKSEIFSGMSPGGIALINQDDWYADFFAGQATEYGLKVIRVGESEGTDLRAVDVQCGAASVQFRVEPDDVTVSLALAGRHQVSNAMLALAVVRQLGVPLDQAAERLATMEPVAGRMSRSYCLGGTLVDDSYNASPGAVKAAVDWLAGQTGGPRMMVLGALAELGEQSATIHRDLGEYARAQGIDALVVMAGDAGPAAEGFGDDASVAASTDEAANLARPVLQAGGTVLVKGSRSARMERVAAALKATGEMH
jgi:UDP-N-acetylmuramoyl-tripeptide--D-alanyl-D-alanine ligase